MVNLQIWGCRGNISAPLQPEEVRSRMLKVVSKLPDEPMRRRELEPFLNQLKPAEFGGYGQLTSTTKLVEDQEFLILGGGTGIRPLGYQFNDSNRKHYHIILNDFNWGNILGLGFFVPIFVRGNIVHFHSPLKDLERAVMEVFSDPYFPLPFHKLGATVEFHYHKWYQKSLIATEKVPGCSDPAGFEVAFYPINDAKEVAAMVIRHKDVSFAQISPFTDGDTKVLEFLEGVQLLQFDVQCCIGPTGYEEISPIFKETLDFATNSRIGRILLSNYGCDHFDQGIENLEKTLDAYCEEYLKEKGKEPVPMAFAREDFPQVVG